MNNQSGVWVDEEFEALGLGDPRRDRRAKALLKRLAAKPSESIPGACDGWSETMAAYRFLGNEEVEWVDMMQPHWERTAARMQRHAVVLCIADTTKLDFNGQGMEGLGPLSFEAQRGMYLHPTYAVTPDRDHWGYWMPGCGRVNRWMRTDNAAASRKVPGGSRAMNAWPNRLQRCQIPA
jgi:hypothetical protein